MRSRRIRYWGLFAGLSLSLTACASGTNEVPHQDSEPSLVATALKVMQFNIEYGGQGVDFSSVSKAIEAAGADVVAIQEGYGQMPAIARDLGWNYYDVRTQTVSKYPLLTPPGAEPGLDYVEVGGGVVAIYNLHLPSNAYGPNKVLAGDSKQEILARETRGRLKALQPALDGAQSQVSQGIPTLVMGDFNAPSNLDWTEATVGLRKQLKYPMPWPTSVAAEDAGLTDVYRTIYPDPVADPGLTWPASRPFVKGYNPGPNGAPADRIDQMYFGGSVTPTAVSIVGESGSDMTDIAVDPWPSDHRAVVASLDVVPGTPFAVVSTDQRLVERGTTAEVRYYTSTGRAGQLAVVRSGGEPGDAVQRESLQDLVNGHWPLDTSTLDTGAYDLLLLDANGLELTRSEFWVVDPGTKPSVSTGSGTYRGGQPIDVGWSGSPGNKWDWLGVYRQNADPNVAYYKLWAYTNATVEGSLALDAKTGSGTWPLPPGKYSVYLLADDSYVILAGAGFTVVPPTTR